MEYLIMREVLMKINKRISCSNFLLSEAEIRGLLHPAEANFGYFLARFHSLQPESPLAPTRKSHVTSEVCSTQL
jgi:hypothetical protein